MDALAHGAFIVGLKGFNAGAKFFAQAAQACIDLVERDRAVLLGVALAKHVVVDAVQHDDFHGESFGWECC